LDVLLDLIVGRLRPLLFIGRHLVWIDCLLVVCVFYRSFGSTGLVFFSWCCSKIKRWEGERFLTRVCVWNVNAERKILDVGEEIAIGES
jgi:hypothetical protein